MMRKPFARTLILIVLILLMTAFGISVLVLAASDDAKPVSQTISLYPETSAPFGETSVLQYASSRKVSTLFRAEQIDTVIPYRTIRVEDDQLALGEELVVQAGVPGLERATDELILHDGIEVSRLHAGTEIVREPTDELIHVGTYVKPTVVAANSAMTETGVRPATHTADTNQNYLQSVVIDEAAQTITTPDGTVYRYSDFFVGEATAYSCEGESNPITYSGTKARVGEVAVDPSVIPLGTRMFIMLSDGSLIYGYCVAEDIGGAVKGNIIDLYMDTFADCCLVGRSPCDVYILS